MIRLEQMRQARQALDRSLRELQEQVKTVQARCEMIRGSVYQRHKRCGKRRCQCWEGPAHVGWVLSVRRKGRSEWMSLQAAEGIRTKGLVENYGRFRQARRQMLRTCQRLLRTTDELGRLRQGESEQ